MLGGKQPKAINACSLFCLFEQLEHFSSKPEVINIVNYATLEEEFTLQLNAEQATYLYGATGDPELSNEPFIYAFDSKAAAEAAQPLLGGELADWETVHELCLKLAADWEPDEAEEPPPAIPHRSHRSE